MLRKTKQQSRLFVGSSSESLDLAYAIQKNLEDDAEITVWTQGVFELTKSAVESLLKVLDRTDFAVFVFAPSDTLRLRQKKYLAVRDNVVFELGLFMGKLGRVRTFFVAPKGQTNLRIPTDLAGITVGTYDPRRRDENLEAALGPFCNDVRRQIRKRGALSPRKVNGKKKRVIHPKGDLVILEAKYGIRDHRIDVKEALNASVKNGKLHVLVGNHLGPRDPCPNMPKNITVRYRYKNDERTKIVAEGDDLDLP